VLTQAAQFRQNARTMRQRYHTIIKPSANGWFVGWVEEVPGTITHGRSLDECRANLKDSLQLMVETNRDTARLGLDPSCILESIEIDLADTMAAQATSHSSRSNTSAYVH
jgi:predicted RNase H-like HicB family nuclease